ncbi:Wzz/FepE/Etk N-terminal domain-containing protein [Marinobacter sediminum]|uniref:Wzz/FepE/Etk N-terminal domain-containing protein n=1 Tax=Marinobacter sediminum TaxID=256323 RepID=UPI0019396D55|nr:Wzz/FepE/Etk N-terminal domain-containing protein [Marinobacter sediminum]
MSENVTQQTYYPDDEIDLRELFSTVWRGKWIIILATFIFAAAGVGFALYKPNIYQSSVLIAPAQEEGGGLGGLASQFGGLASLAGINLGGGSSNKTVIAKEVLQSRAFLTNFFHRHDLEVPLMALDGWNEKSGEWDYDQDKYNPETSEWLLDSDGESYKPTDWEMVETFREDHFSVSEAKETGMITVSVKHYSPVLAKQWAEKLVQDLNEHMRKQDVEEAEARIAYLEEKLDETNVAGMQQVFYQLIENETRTVMLANAQKEYVFKTIDPAVIAEEKAEPKRALICVIATLLGGMFGVFIVFIRAFIGSGPDKVLSGHEVSDAAV